MLKNYLILILLFPCFLTSCSPKLSSVECNHEICDTIDSYRVILTSGTNDTLSILQDDTIMINPQVNSIRLEGWHCRTCKGTEVVIVENSKGKRVDSLYVSHHGNVFESDLWRLDNIKRKEVYKVRWMNGINFCMFRY